MNRLDFEGRTAVITGGAAGIGQAVARRLVDSGARVALWDRDPQALEAAKAALGPATVTLALDVADAGAVDRAAREAAAALGAIDVLVCSAGITGPNTTVWDYPVDEWKRVFDVNVHGLFYCNRAIVPHMRAKNYGRIVNIASVAGKEGNPNASAYSASKAAVIGLTKSLGRELAESGILVNCVTPALIDTPLAGALSDETRTAAFDKIPMRRMGRPDEVAALVAWLASDQVSFSTGAAYDLSGGRASY